MPKACKPPSTIAPVPVPNPPDPTVMSFPLLPNAPPDSTFKEEGCNKSPVPAVTATAVVALPCVTESGPVKVTSPVHVIEGLLELVAPVKVKEFGIVIVEEEFVRVPPLPVRVPALKLLEEENVKFPPLFKETPPEKVLLPPKVMGASTITLPKLELLKSEMTPEKVLEVLPEMVRAVPRSRFPDPLPKVPTLTTLPSILRFVPVNIFNSSKSILAPLVFATINVPEDPLVEKEPRLQLLANVIVAPEIPTMPPPPLTGPLKVEEAPIVNVSPIDKDPAEIAIFTLPTKRFEPKKTSIGQPSYEEFPIVRFPEKPLLLPEIIIELPVVLTLKISRFPEPVKGPVI